MPTPVRMPALGQTSNELRLTAWLKAEGDQIAEGEPLFEAESDKAVHEVEASATGTLLKILYPTEQTLTAGTILAWIGAPDEQIPATETAPQAPAATAMPARTTRDSNGGGPRGERATVPPSAAPPPSAEPASAAPTTRTPATPVARRLAREHGVDIGQLTGSGPNGRIERADVLAAIDTPPASGPTPAAQPPSLQPVPAHRQAIAKRLTRAATIPQFSVAKTIDARPAIGLADDTAGATLTHILLRALGSALEQHPRFNRVWVDDAGAGPHYNALTHAHVGLAIATDDNLIVATIPEPHQITFEQLIASTRQTVKDARAGRVTGTANAPAAITLSNLGMFGIDRFEAIVDPDQTAILAVGQTVKRPAITPEGIIAIPQLDLTLTADHRTVDGVDAARFLTSVCAALES